MVFTPATYDNLVSARTASQERLFLTYIGHRNDFDVVIVGSGLGGGVLADELAERIGGSRRILVIEAGSFLYPTHVYNSTRFSNSAVARHFGCDTFWQAGNPSSERYIGEKPQLNFGGRSIFWSGLIPTLQDWELEFFPPAVRASLKSEYLNAAGAVMNESRSMGATAQAVVDQLRLSSLSEDFLIEQTPRALHQPYLLADGTPRDEFAVESTGVFNTAELLTNQLGLTPGISHGDGPGLHLLLNHYVEDIQNHGNHYQLVCRDTLTGQARYIATHTAVVAAGSIESPKLLRRSSMYPWLPEPVKALLGRGLTDHPTTSDLTARVTAIGPVPIPRHANAKIILYSRGRRDDANRIRYPFNVELNLNHEWWHLRENDPNQRQGSHPDSVSPGPSQLDLKFSFGNFLDDENAVGVPPPYGYVPEISFRNLSWVDHLRHERLPRLAGWNMQSSAEIFDVLNSVAHKLITQFRLDGQTAMPDNRYGEGGKGFGWGTVHHAAGTLRMPYRQRHDGPFITDSVVDEDLRLNGAANLYVCDMSVMPYAAAANPARALVALALRLSRHLAT